MAHTLAHGLIVDDDGMSSSSGSPSSERDTAHVASDTGDTKGKQPPADVRRAKHREVQRRFIERKKEKTLAVKALAQRLEHQHKLVVAHAERSALEREKETLVERVKGVEDARLPSNQEIHALLETHMELVRESFEPLTPTEWMDMLNSSINEFEISSNDSKCVSSGFKIMGWKEKRVVEPNALRFEVSKEFEHMFASEFADIVWNRLLDPATYPKLFSGSLISKMQVLQQISDEAVVIHRMLFIPETGVTSHTIETLCCVPHGRDTIIFLRSLDKSAARRCTGPAIEWVCNSTALVFAPVSIRNSVRGCRFRYCGHLNEFQSADLKYWLQEILWVMLRFESAMVRPIFSLTAPAEEVSVS